MTKSTIDINCDVGEGIGNESNLFAFISSCNIACGGHAGSVATMRLCINLAKQFNVKIGAHPSYPDRENFGRVSMDISDEDLVNSIGRQINSFINECNNLNAKLHHIKPHGALYNDIAKNTHLAEVFLTAIAPYKQKAILYVPYGSLIEEIAVKNGFVIKKEAFADRNYNSDLSLVSRTQAQALITTGKDVLKHLLLMFNENLVETITGEKKSIFADTFCVHGDTPSALQILMYLSEQLPKYNLQTKS
ncbi:5-oxoprolinase subunit PxpA [Maribacter hydrothermalis]|uniref:Lactam utilization protein LamB n=1 Tax=Maribacter hydrothermalis TaxID=1836467 RepID=A0A1B7ZCU3_9FLAO|nr:5-oxoprolinase subunit PxpA [Maribacter hydrothermalis]APQ18671.1 lactam utilization protein LamB [Maribacter hydrothermalis]OBR40939.1 lactam utilization protein LamB [Maribacter hydrothermalis]